MTKHAKLSPSAAARWLACPGSALPEVERRSSLAADNGTVAHAVLDLALRNGVSAETLDANTWPLTGRYATVDAEGDVTFHDTRPVEDYHRVSPAMLRGVAFGVRHVRAVDPVELWVEQRVVPFPEHEDILSGTADIVMRDKHDGLHVIDFKAGRVFVPHRGNPQLLTYMVGAKRRHGAASQHVGIVQPAYAPQIRTVRVSHRELVAFRDKLLAAAELLRVLLDRYSGEDTDDTDTMLSRLHRDGYINGTVDGCRWCPLTEVCPSGPHDEVLRAFVS